MEIKPLISYNRIKTIEVRVGNIVIGGNNPIRIQTMTTTDTMDTDKTVEQCIRCIKAGAELIRITAPNKKEAENLLIIKNKLRQHNYNIPLIADIHYTPNAAEVAAKIVEKVRINPGNYIDKKNFQQIEYTNEEYQKEIEKIKIKFIPLLQICKNNGTAIRIGTNHGSLSDRILSRYGDTPNGMVESAMEFLRIALSQNYNQIILSMKASNPLVMIQAYRLVTKKMQEEFGFCFPLHLGVTEAGDGEDGRIKSAIGIGTLLEEGIGDTIRVSLTEDPEFEIPVCKDIIKRYFKRKLKYIVPEYSNSIKFNPFSYERISTTSLENIGNKNPPIVISDWRKKQNINYEDFISIGYFYDNINDKWNIKDDAADFIYLSKKIKFEYPKSLKIIIPHNNKNINEPNLYNSFNINHLENLNLNNNINFVEWEISNTQYWNQNFNKLKNLNNIVLIISCNQQYPYLLLFRWAQEKINNKNNNPIIWHLEALENNKITIDEQLIHFSTELGALLINGFGDGLFLTAKNEIQNQQLNGRTYINIKDTIHFLNNISFAILQATRTRISKTEYISCPSCGRTLFDLQETTTKIRKATNHLKGLKIAVMGCIVNGPGEMADADFGYVGSGKNKIHLYKGKEIVKKNIDSDIAVQELIQLIKDNGKWND